MLTKEIIEEFFDAIEDTDKDIVETLLQEYPSIVTATLKDKKAYQLADAELDKVKEMHQKDPSCPANQEYLEMTKEIFNTIKDATVLYAIDNQDLSLLKHMKEHNNLPYLTLSNGINPRMYARDTNKTDVVDWIKSILNQSKKDLGMTDGNPYMMFADDKKAMEEKTAALSVLKNNAIIEAGSAAINALSINK